MSEYPINSTELDNETPLDREELVTRLNELGIDLKPEDLEDEDDNDVMGIIMTYAEMYDLDSEEVLRLVVPIEKHDNETPPRFVIERMTPDDVEEATEMRLQSWLDTYSNDAAGVSREWVERRNAEQRSPERMIARKKQLENEKYAGWVARDGEGHIIGVTSPYVDEEGIQHLGSLYVDKSFHGSGVGGALMQTVIDYFDDEKSILLGVVEYNERAKAFYKKWGFIEIPNSLAYFDETIPEVEMVRPPQSHLAREAQTE